MAMHSRQNSDGARRKDRFDYINCLTWAAKELIMILP